MHHEHARGGSVKLLTLFRPATGQVRAKGALSAPNAVLHPWLIRLGIMPLYTPLEGSWLNMAESVQRIIVRRALAGQHPEWAQELIDWLEPARQRVECGPPFCLGWQKPPAA